MGPLTGLPGQTGMYAVILSQAMPLARFYKLLGSQAELCEEAVSLAKFCDDTELQPVLCNHPWSGSTAGCIPLIGSVTGWSMFSERLHLNIVTYGLQDQVGSLAVIG